MALRRRRKEFVRKKSKGNIGEIPKKYAVANCGAQCQYTWTMLHKCNTTNGAVVTLSLQPEFGDKQLIATSQQFCSFHGIYFVGGQWEAGGHFVRCLVAATLTGPLNSLIRKHNFTSRRSY